MSTIIDSYSEAYSTTPVVLGNSVPGLGQTFTCSVTGYGITSCKHYLHNGTGDCTGNAYAKLYAHTGTFGSTGLPTGPALATSDAVDVTTITGWGLVTFTFSGAEQYVMSNGTHYCITVEYDSGDAGKYLYYGHDAAFLTHQGNSLYNVGSWNAYTPRDMCFYVYGDPLTTPGITIAGRKVRVVTNTDVTPTTALTIDSSQNALFAAKAIFTQSDGNEYIDSLNDAYLDYGATTGHRFRINGTEQINLIDGVLAPKTDSDVDLGTSALYFKNLYIDSITTTGTILASDKVIFTQTDGNEYIDSLADGYMNYGATTGHRFNSDILLNGDNRKICFGTGEASDSYIHYDGSEIDILSAGAINLEPGTSLEIGGVAGWSGWFDDGTNFRVTVTKGLITAVDNSTAGGHNP